MSLYDDIKNAEEEWEREVLEPALGKHPERKEDFVTGSHLPVNRVYLPSDAPDSQYLEKLGFPGQYPYARGVQPTMYRGKLWTMRQYAGFGSAEETNRRFRYLLDQGQTGLSVAFDLPTQIGYDSDDSITEGEVGKVGVAVDTIRDMEILFDRIPLDKVSTSMTINAPAAVLLAMYVVVAERQGVSRAAIRGTIQNDILKEYVARGTYIFPPAPSMRIINDIFAFCSRETPRWNIISISGYHIREAGSTAVQEIAFTIADGIEYVKSALHVGLDVDSFAGRLSFFFAAHNDLLEEVAKFRAARRIWAKIMRERFGAKKEKSMMMRFHTQTCGSTLTGQQPDNNVVRVAVQTLAAVLGGTQSLHTNSRDEAHALPSEESVRIALRTQQIIAHESGVADTVDPLAGSYYVEYMTDRIEQEVHEYLAKIDGMGGMVKAIEKGYVQKEIQDAAYRYQREVESGERLVVGVNSYKSEEQKMTGLHKVDPEIRELQTGKLEETKGSRDEAAVGRSLESLRSAAGDEQVNLMPPIIEAVKNYATLGEICGVLREEFGEYRDSMIF